MSGEGATKDAEAIRFNIYLRRNGKFVPTCFSNIELDQAELEEFLRPASVGDQILIVPVGTESWKAKRILIIGKECLLRLFEYSLKGDLRLEFSYTVDWRYCRRTAHC